MRKFLFLMVFIITVYLTNESNICIAQWQPDVRLTNDDSLSFLSQNNTKCVLSSISNIHAVWCDKRNGNNEIYYKRTTNGGITWGTDTRLTNNSANSYNPTIAVYNSIIHLCWIDNRDGNYEIYYKRSIDGGINWETDTRLTNNSAESRCQSMAINGNYIHITWTDLRDGNPEVYYKKSVDSGISWGTDIRLTNNTAASDDPCIAVSETNIQIVWSDTRHGNYYEIYHKKSTDSGNTWNTDTRITENPNNSSFPNISISENFVNIIWCDSRDGNTEIYYKKSTNYGLSWQTDTRLTNNTGNSLYPNLLTSGNAIHIVWMDNRDGNYEIYYKRSINLGLSWEIDTRLTNNSATSYNPFITVNGTTIHLIWQDNREGNFEIFYKYNATGNPTRIEKIKTEGQNSFDLRQNYPNPFNPLTKIHFDVAKYEDVKIAAYDISGKELDIIVNKRMQPGIYEVEWNGEKYSSGIYFYRMQAGDYIETRKMILMK